MGKGRVEAIVWENMKHPSTHYLTIFFPKSGCILIFITDIIPVCGFHHIGKV